MGGEDGKHLELKLGASENLDGWNIGLLGMKIGTTRKITCPPSAAYGAKGCPPIIPPKATLVFTFNLIDIIVGGQI